MYGSYAKTFMSKARANLASDLRREACRVALSSVEIRLLERGHILERLPDALRVEFRVRSPQTRQHGEQRRDIGRMRCDSVGQPIGDQRLPIDLALHPVIAEVGHLDQVHTPLEGREVLVLLERVEMQLIRAGEEEHIEMQDGVGQGYGPLLAGRQQVLVALDRLLQKVVVLDDAAVRLHEISERFVQLKVPKRSGQRGEPLVRGELSDARVHVHLRLDGDDTHAIAP